MTAHGQPSYNFWSVSIYIFGCPYFEQGFVLYSWICQCILMWSPVAADDRNLAGDGDENPSKTHRFWRIWLMPMDNFFLIILSFSWFFSPTFLHRNFIKYTRKGAIGDFMGVRRTTASVFLVVRRLFWVSRAHWRPKFRTLLLKTHSEI